MDMKIVKSEKCLCMCCMEEHEVKTVLVKEVSLYKNKKVSYEAAYLYCDEAQELYMNEQQLKDNALCMKNAYRKAEGLLTSNEICAIRKKYGITQNDLSVLLGWGAKTITRYESHQVQDKAHDTILKKLCQDPEWFLSLLNDAKQYLTTEAYQKYLATATALYETDRDSYLCKSIEAEYAKFRGNQMLHGNTPLSLEKAAEVIRYFAASPKIMNLYKVKLMKLVWYADALSYKHTGSSITGLVYQALPMGAVPVGHDSMIDLSNVPCEEVDMGETTAYYFSIKDAGALKYLTEEDRKILDKVIEKLGKMTKNEIVSFMHQEKAYKETRPREFISFAYAKYLQI